MTAGLCEGAVGVMTHHSSIPPSVPAAKCGGRACSTARSQPYGLEAAAGDRSDGAWRVVVMGQRGATSPIDKHELAAASITVHKIEHSIKKS